MREFPGEGPGEFQVPGAVRFIADTLTVLEFRRGISLLSPEGEYLTRVSFVLDTLVSQPIDGEYALIEVPGSGPLTVSHPTAWNDIFAVPPEGAGFVAVDRSAGFDRVQPAFRLFRIDLAWRRERLTRGAPFGILRLERPRGGCPNRRGGPFCRIPRRG